MTNEEVLRRMGTKTIMDTFNWNELDFFKTGYILRHVGIVKLIMEGYVEVRDLDEDFVIFI